MCDLFEIPRSLEAARGRGQFWHPETKAAITMVLSQEVGSFPIIHEKKNLGNHSRGIR